MRYSTNVSIYELNNRQRRAVETHDGPVAIIAGPGTGKTKTLTSRITYLLENGRALPHEILALTFTKKAAQEMSERVRRQDVTICTFHALCQRLLPATQPLVTEPERLRIIKSLSKPRAFTGMSAREIGLRISRTKNQAESDDDMRAMVTAYDAALHAAGVIDFDDLLVHACRLLEEYPAKKPSYTCILIDEFQDTNILQYQLLQRIRRTDNLFVIGDPNQSIYGFRGADGGIFERFAADFPAVDTIELTDNYRSSPQIVSLANAVFPTAPRLQPRLTADGHVQAFELLNEYSEAQWIVGRIEDALGGANLQQATYRTARASLRDFAILYRNRRAGAQVQQYIANSGLPYQIVGDGSPYDKPDLQLLLTLLMRQAGKDIAVPGLTEPIVASLLQKTAQMYKPVEVAERLAHLLGQTITSDVRQFLGMLVRFNTIADAAAHLEQLYSSQFYDPAAEAISLLTIHAAKGLEFPHVFVVGAEEGVLPGTRAQVEEEKRLFYVAVTRAKHHLDITHVTRRRGESAIPSQFITEISDSLLPRVQDPHLAHDARRGQKRHAKRAQTSLF